MSYQAPESFDHRYLSYKAMPFSILPVKGNDLDLLRVRWRTDTAPSRLHTNSRVSHHLKTHYPSTPSPSSSFNISTHISPTQSPTPRTFFRPDARTPLMLLRFLVVDKEFAVFAVAARFRVRDADNGEDGRRLEEDAVHLFEGAVGGFWVEEVDDGEDEGVAVGWGAGEVSLMVACGWLGQARKGEGEGTYMTANMMYVL